MAITGWRISGLTPTTAAVDRLNFALTRSVGFVCSSISWARVRMKPTFKTAVCQSDEDRPRPASNDVLAHWSLCRHPEAAHTKSPATGERG